MKINPEKLNELLKRIMPKALSEDSFLRNFIAYKIAQHEKEILED